MRRGEERRGIAAAEAAILLPVLVFAFVVTIDFCRVYVCTQTLQACADTGVRYAAGVSRGTSGSATTDAENAAVAAGVSLNPQLATSNVNVNIQNNTATVTVTWTFSTFIPYPFMPSQITITRTAIAQVTPVAFK
jgi:Flp pilus assembly protein TadG